MKFFTTFLNKLFPLSERNLIDRCVKSGNVSDFVKLLEIGVDLNARDRDGRNILMRSAIYSNRDLVVEILKNNIVDINEKDNSESTALIYGAKSGNKDIVDSILVMKPELDERDLNGFNALNYAVRNGSKDIENMLKSENAEPHRPIHDLVDRGLVDASVNAINITEGEMEIRNKTNKNIDVVVPTGTRLLGPPDVQPMVVNENQNISLKPKQNFTTSLDYSCLDASKSIPKNVRMTTINMSDPHTVRLMRALEGKDSMTKQAAVWAFRNSMTDQQLQNRLLNESGDSLITAANISEARRILRSIQEWRNRKM